MKTRTIWNIRIDKGKLEIIDRNQWQFQFGEKTGEFQMVVKPHFKQRSLPQNSYYWGVCIPLIADEIGELDLNYVHALLKGMFLAKHKTIKGKDYTAVGKTSKMSTAQFSEYIEKVRMWASQELGLNIPDPDSTHNERAVLYEEDED